MKTMYFATKLTIGSLTLLLATIANGQAPMSLNGLPFHAMHTTPWVQAPLSDPSDPNAPTMPPPPKSLRKAKLTIDVSKVIYDYGTSTNPSYPVSATVEFVCSKVLDIDVYELDGVNLWPVASAGSCQTKLEGQEAIINIGGQINLGPGIFKGQVTTMKVFGGYISTSAFDPTFPISNPFFQFNGFSTKDLDLKTGLLTISQDPAISCTPGQNGQHVCSGRPEIVTATYTFED